MASGVDGDRLLGIVGGLSPYATILYYRSIVEEYRGRRGVDPRLVVYSVPVQEMCSFMSRGDLAGAAGLLSEAFRGLRGAGASAALVAANTPHAALRFADTAGLRVLHIVEPVARRLRGLGVRRVGLLATSATLRYRVYHDVLEPLGFEVVAPRRGVQERLDEAITRATRGELGEEDLGFMLDVAQGLVEAGAEAVVLGCTELGLYRDRFRGALSVPVVDSLEEHVAAAVEWLLGG